MKLIENREFTNNALQLIGRSICENIEWNNPVDNLLVHAYIARNQHKVIIESKHKRDELDEGPSKRSTKVEKSQQ